MSYFGIDLSEFNGSADWKTLAKNIDFAIIRIGWVGNNGNHAIDKKFEEHYRAARAAGIKIGMYVYIYSKSEAAAREGAEWAVKQLAGKTINLPVYCDMEDSSLIELGREKITAVAKAFNSVIEKHGFWAGIYANRNWYDNYLEKDIQKRYTSWIADYTSGTDKYEGEYDMWQNSSDGRVDGLDGRVDTNYLYRNLFREIKGREDYADKEKFPAPLRWQNGSTPEMVYADTDKSLYVGKIFPYERADCFAKINGMYLVNYNVTGAKVQKAGFVEYHGGIK